MLPLKKKKTKQKSETVLAENVCKPLRAEEEGGWCLKEQVNATTYVKVKKMLVFKLMLKKITKRDVDPNSFYFILKKSFD